MCWRTKAAGDGKGGIRRQSRKSRLEVKHALFSVQRRTVGWFCAKDVVTTIRFYDSELIVTTTSTTAETKSFYEVMTVAHITRRGRMREMPVYSFINRSTNIYRILPLGRKLWTRKTRNLLEKKLTSLNQSGK